MYNMDQIIPILIHTKKTYDGSYFYVDYDVNVSAVISHQAAQTLIDDESNALKEKYRKKDACLGESYDNYSETILSGQPKKRRLPPSYFFRRFIWLSRKVYAATTGTSQPSAFNFLRYALILRSLLN